MPDPVDQEARMPFDHVMLHRTDGIAVLRLASGKTNALSQTLVMECHGALDELESDGDLVGLVLTGGEAPFFSYGLDVAGLLALDRIEMTRFLEQFNRLLARLFIHPRPVVAAVNGHAMAGGLLLALVADARVGSQGTYSLGLPEVKLGLAAPAGSLRMMARRLGDACTAELALGGTTLTPEAARDRGILGELVPPATLLERAMEIARTLADAPPGAIALNKQFLARGVYDQIPQVAHREDADWIDRWFSPEAQSRLQKLAERR